MKVTVFGGTNNKKYTPREQKECAKLGKFLGDIGAEVLTGACGGFPYFVGKSAKDGGCRVYGYTPALNLEEHVEKYKFPTDGVTDLVFAKQQDNAVNFMQRSLDMGPYGDVVVGMGGSWGTYFELLISFYGFKKPMILIGEFGGAVEAFNNTYEFFGAREINEAVHFGAQIIRVPTVEDAIARLKGLLVK